ncbi:MAG: hypothetical protein KY476_13640 [Planctomycetes bacterium]|nr:hypothetical protein [Planctomycetota bacterium]
MTYHGRVQNGVIILDDDVRLPEGTRVNVVVAEAPARPDQRAPVGQMLLKHAGKAEGLPPDASINLDQYLYG